MLTHLKTIVFLLLTVVFLPFANAQAQELTLQQPQQNVAPQPTEQSAVNTNVSTEVNSLLSLLPNSSSPACTDVANQIATVSAMKISDKVYPWEDLDWLKKNVGQPKLAQTNNEKSFYAWICLNPGGTTNMVLYITMNQAGVKRTMIESMICKSGEACQGYGFERNGSKINGFSVQSSSLFQK